jgi:hypothetical protein
VTRDLSRPQVTAMLGVPDREATSRHKRKTADEKTLKFDNCRFSTVSTVFALRLRYVQWPVVPRIVHFVIATRSLGLTMTKVQNSAQSSQRLDRYDRAIVINGEQVGVSQVCSRCPDGTARNCSVAQTHQAEAEDVMRRISQTRPNILRELCVRSTQHTGCNSGFAREWPRS